MFVFLRVGKDSHEDGIELIMPTPTLTASNGAPGVMNAMTPTMTKSGEEIECIERQNTTYLSLLCGRE
jgi:hypothetical protein